MRIAKSLSVVVGLMLLLPTIGVGEEVLFEDDFKKGLSEKWEVVGLKKADYRVRDSGLEMRVQPGKLDAKPPMLKVMLPFKSSDTVTVSVKVTLLDEFTQDHELAGVYLLDETGLEFGAKKERVDGKTVFAPGKYQFKGKRGDEGDPKNYDVIYTPVTKEAGPLRILMDRGNAFFQVGPSKDDEYLNFFHSAIRKDEKQRGFGLTAVGAPDGVQHWVRFEAVRVVRE